MATPILAPLALITGGDSGIGFELAQQFAADAYDLLLVSENEAGLADAKIQLEALFPKCNVHTFAQDLTAANGPAAVRAYTQQENLIVAVLVNNAGIGSFGFYTELDAKREQEILQLNVLALEAMTRLFLPDLLDSKRGGLIQLASIAAFQPVPSMATYAASKAFVLHFSKALRAELREQGHQLPVLAVCPSGTRATGFMDRAGMTDNPLFENFMSVGPQDVAKRAYRAFQKNKAEVIIPGWLSLLAPLIRRLPRRLLTWQARQTLKP